MNNRLSPKASSTILTQFITNLNLMRMLVQNMYRGIKTPSQELPSKHHDHSQGENLNFKSKLFSLVKSSTLLMILSFVMLSGTALLGQDPCTGNVPIENLANGMDYTIVSGPDGTVDITLTVVDNPAGLVGFFGGAGNPISFPDANGTFTYNIPGQTIGDPFVLDMFFNWAAGGAGNSQTVTITVGSCTTGGTCTGNVAIENLANGMDYTIVSDASGNVDVTLTVVDNPAGLVGFFGGAGNPISFPDASGTFTYNFTGQTVGDPFVVDMFFNWAAGGAGNSETIIITVGGACVPPAVTCTGNVAIENLANGMDYTIVSDASGTVDVTLTVVDNPVGLVGFFGGAGNPISFPDASGTFTYNFTGQTVGDAFVVDMFFNWAAGGAGNSETVTITVNGPCFGAVPTTNAPEPTCPAADVVSIYGDFYSPDIATNYDPNWGQSGFGLVDPNYDPGTGNPVLAYPNFNYQGTELTTTDLSGMDNLNFDIWTAADPAATFLQVSPVQMGPLEFLVDVPYVQGQWTHISIPMADFVGMDWTDVFQMKFAANGPGSVVPVDIYLDNIYFSTCAPPCSITNFSVTDPVCGSGFNADDSYFTATFDVTNGSGDYLLLNPANNISYGAGPGLATDGQVSFLGQASVGGNMEGQTASVIVVDQANGACMAGPLTITLPFCPPCTLTSAPCADCLPGSENTDIEIASLGAIPFAGGPGASASFDPMTNSGTVMLTAGTDGVFAGFDVGDFTLPSDLNDLCITADIDLVSGSVPFTLEFRIEKAGGPFGGGSALAFNADIDGPGVCSIGGSQADGMNINGFTYDGGSDYSIVVAIANFAGPAALPDDVIINVSNISFSYCAPIPVCTLTAGACVTCGTCEESVDVDLTAGTAFNVAQQFGPGFCCFQENMPGTYDNGTNMGTLTLPEGGVNAFSVAGVNDLNLPDYVTDICLTADIDVVSGAYPFVLEFRLENGTGAPGNGGQAMTFDVMVDGQGMCSVGGSGSVNGVPVNGFAYVPGANYSVVIGLSDFSGNPIPEDIEVVVSNISLNVCAADDVAPTLVCPNSEELLSNGDFSNVITPSAFPAPADFASWGEFGDTYDDAFTAKQTLKLFGPVSGVTQEAPIAAGDWLCSYADVITTSLDNIVGLASWAEIKIEFLDAGGAIVQDAVLADYDRGVAATPNVWTTFGGCVEAPTGAVTARSVIIFLNLAGEPGSIIVDNVTMQKINPVYFEANADGCTADATITNPAPTDACGVVSFTNSFNGTDDASGNYPLGKTLVTYNAVDANGNESFCSILVEVGDMTAPTITCPGDIVQDNDLGQCGAVVTFDVVGDDICD